MKDGRNINAVVAAFNPYDVNHVAFVTEDLFSESRSMNDTDTNSGGWRDCSMRTYLNRDVFSLLPDDLQSVITERRIVQSKDGVEMISSDKLWLLSCTEIGEYCITDTEDVHFPLFKDQRSRVKQEDGSTWWYWLRTPYTCSDKDETGVKANCTYFYFVTDGGYTMGNAASYCHGVAFGFMI